MRYGRWLRITNADIDRASTWFERREVVAVLVGRCIPLIRSLVSIPAGFRHMPFAMFTLYTAIGSAIWNTALITAGYVLRENWEDVEPVLDIVQIVVVVLIVVGLVWFVWSRRRGVPVTAEHGRCSAQQGRVVVYARSLIRRYDGCVARRDAVRGDGRRRRHRCRLRWRVSSATPAAAQMAPATNPPIPNSAGCR